MGVATVAILLAFGPELDACGDKSLAAGGIRQQRALAARYPASIVAYVPAASRLPAATSELKLEERLRQVGHKYREAVSLAELHATIVSAQANIVLADVADLAALQADPTLSRAGVVLVPVAHKPAKAEARELSKQWRFTIKAPSREVEYLKTIAEAVKSRGSTSRKS
jgi:hypothetical protein